MLIWTYIIHHGHQSQKPRQTINGNMTDRWPTGAVEIGRLSYYFNKERVIKLEMC